MSVTSSENNIKDTSLESLSPTLQNSIKKIIKKENYTKYDAVIQCFDVCGKNFLSKIYEIDIIGETVHGKKNTNLFVKECIDLKGCTWMAVTQMFPNEAFIYKEFSKLIESLQDQANVPKEDRYRMMRAYDETDDSAIILENVSNKGFKTYDKMERTPFKFAELAVEQLAKFHAFSFIIEKKMPEFYENKIKKIDNIYTLNDLMRMLIRKICAHVATLFDGEEKRKVERFLPVFLEKFEKYHHERSGVKCTLTHGDFKKNNLMFRLRDGEPEELVIIDFQLIDYGCPIKDLMMFMFTEIDPEFRRRHMTELKGTYFSTMSRFLKYFDMDIETVYPRREFERVFTEWLEFGLMTSLFISAFSFASYEGLDMVKLVLTDAAFTPDEKTDHIYRALVEDFIKWGVL